MAVKEQLKVLCRGVKAWNAWRVQNPDVRPDPRGADLSWAHLPGADLESAILVETNLIGADLTGCRVYGISAWDLKLEGAKQKNLIVTPRNQPEITVDNLEVAQFIYLLLRNEKIRRVIDTITSKVVLILGRFTPERKAVLDALREELRNHHYLPVLFDFSPSESRDITETVSLLARMARFVVADITNTRSIPQELSVIVPDLPSVPVQPLLLAGAGEYGMFEHFQRYPWVLTTYVYASPDELIGNLVERVIGPAEAKALELRGVHHRGSRRRRIKARSDQRRRERSLSPHGMSGRERGRNTLFIPGRRSGSVALRCRG